MDDRYENLERFSREKADAVAQKLALLGKGRGINEHIDAMRGIEFPPNVSREATAFFSKIRNDINGGLAESDLSIENIRAANPELVGVIEKGLDLAEILSSDASDRDKKLAIVGTAAAAAAAIPVVGTVASLAIGIIGTVAVFLEPLFKPLSIPPLTVEEELALQWTEWTTGNKYMKIPYRGFRGYFEPEIEFGRKYRRAEFEAWYDYVKDNTNDVLVYIPHFTGNWETIYLYGISQRFKEYNLSIERRIGEGENALRSNYFNRYNDYEKFLTELVSAPDSLQLRIDASAALTRQPIEFQGKTSVRDIEKSFEPLSNVTVSNALRLIRYGVFDLKGAGSGESYYGLKAIIKQAGRIAKGIWAADGKYYANPRYYGLDNQRTNQYNQNKSAFERQIAVLTSESTVQIIRESVIFKSQTDFFLGAQGLPVDLTTGDFLSTFPNVSALQRTMNDIEAKYNVRFDTSRALTSLNGEPLPPRIVKDADGRYEPSIIPASSGVKNALSFEDNEKFKQVALAAAIAGVVFLR